MKMFKEKVNARTDARTTDHDISSLAYGQWSQKTRNRRVSEIDAPAKLYWSQICHMRDISVNLVDMFLTIY